MADFSQSAEPEAGPSTLGDLLKQKMNSSEE